MMFSMDANTEPWDLTAEQHLDRARKLLADAPRAGDPVWKVQTASVLAERHIAWASLMHAEAAVLGRNT